MKMKFDICKNYDEMSKHAAKIFADLIKEKPNAVLGLATGSTPEGMYDELSGAELDFSSIKTVNLDEYYPISPYNENSYRYFMNKHLFSRVNVKIENTYVPNGSAADPEKECKEYDELIEKLGGIDLQVLGIGPNGHIGFNEPGSELFSNTHVTALTESTIAANSRFFDNISDVPTKALTMGMSSILSAKKIVLLISGKVKHNALKALLNDKITPNVPATFLKLHRDVTVICDTDAYNG